MYVQTLEEAYTMVCMFTSNSVKKNVPSKELPTKVCYVHYCLSIIMHQCLTLFLQYVSVQS